MTGRDERSDGCGATRGRGAIANVRGRFAVTDVVADPGPPTEAATTEVSTEATRTILTTNDSPDIPFSTSINPYRGCEHGCVYCFARPTHAYLDLSPGLDFETKIIAKPAAPALLRRELARRGYVPSAIALGSNTDPWQPVERELRITRAILEVLAEHRHPLVAVTKSATILRDVDILAPMAADGLAAAYVSITTLDPELAAALEPRAAAPERRLRTIAGLAAAGIPVGVLASPIIPAINEPELERVLAAARDAGARTASYTVVRLPHEVATIFEQWLRVHLPHRADRVLARIRDLGGGVLYDARFGRRMRGVGPWATLLHRRFEVAARRLGLDGPPPELDATRFRVPRSPGTQQRLFG